MTFNNKISKLYFEYKNKDNQSSFIQVKTELYRLLLDVISDNDEEFNLFYKNHISNLELKQYYFTRLSNPYRECIFNSFVDATDFIDKVSAFINDEEFYNELNSFLSKIIASTTNTKKAIITIKKQKKKYISATLKRLVWNKWVGEEIGKTNCLCCNVTAITQLSFHAGHIIAEANGGETNISNLKPICQNCNSSMGKKNMKIIIIMTMMK